MKCEFGFCSVCEKEIAPACPQCSTRKPGSDYTEVEMAWSNGAKMKIAVCVACAVANAHHTQKAKEHLTKAHHDHWDKHHGKYDKAVVLV